MAETTAINQTILRVLPPGITPPFVLRYSATNVPILQLALESPTLSEQQLYDYGLNFIRTQLATVQGAQVPLPWGGKTRQIMVDLHPEALYAKGLSPIDVSNALGTQNVILPAGTAKMGPTEYVVRTNSSPDAFETLNDIPVRQDGPATVYLSDVAQVHDGFAIQTSMVHVDGQRSALLTVLKTAKTRRRSTSCSACAHALPRIQTTLPPDLEITPLFDQSVFVRAALNGVFIEAAIAAVLTGLMILLFLGSWRSTLVIVVSIPLSILVSIIVFSSMGQTLNTMTLGGLALAVGILVDDATVEIENVNRNFGMGKPITRAILDGAQQIAAPAFVSTLCICIVFVPVIFITGVAKYLFTPLALAVVLAMLASYFLSRTVVPTMVHYLLPAEAHLHQEGHSAVDGGWIWAVHQRFNHHFARLQAAYRRALAWSLDHARTVMLAFAALVVLSLSIFPLLGMDFFPSVDAGQFRLHVRCPAGTRIEETEVRYAEVEAVIRETIPSDEIQIVINNIGIPGGGVNLAFSDTSILSGADGEILVALNPEKHAPTPSYIERLRTILPQRFPDLVFFFQPADMVSQILNFGLPAPIDVQVIGRDPKNVEVARDLVRRIAAIPGAVDVRLQQVVDTPTIGIDVDRRLAKQLGFTERDVASSLLVSLSGIAQIAPSYWLNLQNGVNYAVGVQTPQYRIDSIDTLNSTPITVPGLPRPQLLANIAATQRDVQPAVISHYNIQPVLDVLTGVQGADLWSVSSAVRAGRRRGASDAPARHLHHHPRSSRGHAQQLHHHGLWHAARRRARVLADGGELPIVVGPADHPDGLAGRARRCAVDPLADPDQRVGAGAAGRDHVHRRGHRQLQPGRHVCQRPAARGEGGDPRRARSRHGAPAPGADDRPGDDPRHAADVARPRRRRRAECAARPRRHRRPAAGHVRHLVLRPGGLQPAAPPAGPDGRRSGSPVMAAPDVTADSRPASPPPSRSGRRRMIAVAGSLLVALFLAGLLPRLSLWHRLDRHAQAARDALPVVTTTQPQRAAAVVDVPLPGTTEPILVTGIFARTDGYLEARYVDIGDERNRGPAARRDRHARDRSAAQPSAGHAGAVSKPTS